jgi:hypothetical protein
VTPKSTSEAKEIEERDRGESQEEAEIEESEGIGKKAELKVRIKNQW